MDESFGVENVIGCYLKCSGFWMALHGTALFTFLIGVVKFYLTVNVFCRDNYSLVSALHFSGV
ncbi:hypothetical protein [Teredinibacter purpureus]|uniref:hypothetical protein n=1 Tax=Teredinibacter purpureus TaxID=2731756 RepID=UPI0005F7B7E4|nr:hypothetical protein [Teredinibacter purpureus]